MVEDFPEEESCLKALSSFSLLLLYLFSQSSLPNKVVNRKQSLMSFREFPRQESAPVFDIVKETLFAMVCLPHTNLWFFVKLTLALFFSISIHKREICLRSLSLVNKGSFQSHLRGLKRCVILRNEKGSNRQLCVSPPI